MTTKGGWTITVKPGGIFFFNAVRWVVKAVVVDERELVLAIRDWQRKIKPRLELRLKPGGLFCPALVLTRRLK